jgi:hypothetical protein
MGSKCHSFISLDVFPSHTLLLTWLKQCGFFKVYMQRINVQVRVRFSILESFVVGLKGTLV